MIKVLQGCSNVNPLDRPDLRLVRVDSAGAPEPVRYPHGAAAFRRRCTLGGVQIAAAGGIVIDESGRILLVKRGKPPEAGRWTVPGGKSWPGEHPAQTCVREVFEETGVRVAVIRPAGQVVRPAGGADEFVIDDYLCRVVPPIRDPVAADDATDAGWFRHDELGGLPLVTGLLDALNGWQIFS